MPHQLVQGSVVSAPLLDAEQRKRVGLPTSENEPAPVMVELNLRHTQGLPGASETFLQLYQQTLGDTAQQRNPPSLIASNYFRCDLTLTEIQKIVRADMEHAPSERSIYHVWPDFAVRPLIDRSVSTVKADAAQRSYGALGNGAVWAVIDSGINGQHPHFAAYNTLGGDTASLHGDFTGGNSPLTDNFGHGTHVAGIIGGGIVAPVPPDLRIAQHVLDPAGNPTLQDRHLEDGSSLAGVAPRCKIVSLKVLDDHGNGQASNVMAALQYVREEVNGNGKMLRIHGVNLSVGYEFDAEWFACGQSPLCVEVDRLVRSGVVVVAAAGNTGYGTLSSFARETSTGLQLTINDPGNSSLAITVGATHRDMPHTYGVSYFSSKGPTGDGRLKPDLVAPGERITSCASGQNLAQMYGANPPAAAPAYIDDSGTSMAAPHVSGAIAAFLSIRNDYAGKPEEIKQVFLDNATTLGREPYFQGHGLIDLMRAIQAV